MRKLAILVRIAACAVSVGMACAAVEAAMPPDWQAELSAHGRWSTSTHYGRVWQPTVSTTGWNPYHDGHWVTTDLGLTWVSHYTWGAIAYHYGTWAMEPGRGWVWIPGDVWAPSWVVFRTGGGYIGWAPVAPDFVIGGAVDGWADADAVFVFVPGGQFFAPRIRTCALPASRTASLVTRTKLVEKSLRLENRVVVNRGPSLEELKRATGRPVSVVRLESVKGMEPRIRRTITVEDGRSRSGVRACNASAAPARRERIAGTAPDAYGARAATARTDESRDRPQGSARTAYDETERPLSGRIVHQEAVPGRQGEPVPGSSTVRTAHQEIEPEDAYASHDPVPSAVPRAARARAGEEGETRSDRDVRLLANREKLDRARSRAVKSARSKNRS